MLRFPGGPFEFSFYNCFQVHRQGAGRFYSMFAGGCHAQNISAAVHVRRINLITYDDLFITPLGQNSARAELMESAKPQNRHSADTLFSAGCSHWAAELGLQCQCWAEGISFLSIPGCAHSTGGKAKPPTAEASSPPGQWQQHSLSCFICCALGADMKHASSVKLNGFLFY